MNQRQRPNIVFLFSDQQHWRAVGHRDSFFDTPNIDALAQQSVVLENAFCSTPQCSPSRSSILTGLYPSRTGVMGNIGAAGGQPLALPTIGTALQQAGYHTAYFGKWHLGKNPVGIAGWHEDFGVTGPETTDDQAVTQHALPYLQKRRSQPDQPFALFLSYNNPHHIYGWQNRDISAGEQTPLPPSCTGQALDGKPAVQRQFMTEDQGHIMIQASRQRWQQYRVWYRHCVHEFDQHVGRVVAALRQEGLLDQTLLVVTSDHGDMDTHHGLIFKGPFMYEQMVRVPAYVRLPAMWGRPVQRIDRDTQTINVDWFTTLLEAAGGSSIHTDGVSLLSALKTGSSLQRPFLVSEYYSKQQWVNPIRMLRTPTTKYVRYTGRGEELYDLSTDPNELINLIGDPVHADQRLAMAQLLEQWMGQRNDPFPTQTATTRDGRPLNQELPT